MSSRESKVRFCTRSEALAEFPDFVFALEEAAKKAQLGEVPIVPDLKQQESVVEAPSSSRLLKPVFSLLAQVGWGG